MSHMWIRFSWCGRHCGDSSWWPLCQCLQVVHAVECPDIPGPGYLVRSGLLGTGGFGWLPGLASSGWSHVWLLQGHLSAYPWCPRPDGFHGAAEENAEWGGQLAQCLSGPSRCSPTGSGCPSGDGTVYRAAMPYYCLPCKPAPRCSMQAQCRQSPEASPETCTWYKCLVIGGHSWSRHRDARQGPGDLAVSFALKICLRSQEPGMPMFSDALMQDMLMEVLPPEPLEFASGFTLGQSDLSLGSLPVGQPSLRACPLRRTGL